MKAASLTLTQARATLAPLGVTLRKTDGEFCVRLKGSPSGHGYFTNDLADTVATGQDMARRFATLCNALSEPTHDLSRMPFNV